MPEQLPSFKEWRRYTRRERRPGVGDVVQILSSFVLVAIKVLVMVLVWDSIDYLVKCIVTPVTLDSETICVCSKVFILLLTCIQVTLMCF